MKGKKAAAMGPFENGYGAVRIGDGRWGARLTEGDGADIADGEMLEITDVEGSILVVARG